MGTLEFIQNHFMHAFPILLAGGFAVAITLERINAIFVTYPMIDQRGFFDKVTELILSGKTNEAADLCDKYPKKPLARMVKAALVRAHLPEGMIEHGLQYSLGEATQTIQKRTSFLATIANIATLLGLFGTILGLIHSFEAVGHADAQQKSQLLAAGIATAMNATMLGLGVAIPSMIAYSFIVNRSGRIVADLENAAVRVMEILKQRYYTIENFENNEEPGEKSKSRRSSRVIPTGKSA